MDAVLVLLEGESRVPWRVLVRVATGMLVSRAENGVVVSMKMWSGGQSRWTVVG
jgi:hypothetical protein